MKTAIVALILIIAGCYAGSAQKVFKGKWVGSNGDVELCLNLYEKTVTIPEVEDDEQTPSYGYLSTVYPIGFRMDMDQIESATIDGNTAVVIFRCDRTDAKGKAQLVYNPSDGSMKFTVLEVPRTEDWSDCLAPNITLKKAK